MQRIQRYVVKSDASQLQNVLEFVDWKELARRILAVVVNVIILMDLCYELWSIWTVHFFTLNKGRFSYLKSSPNCNNDNVTLNDVWLFCVELLNVSNAQDDWRVTVLLEFGRWFNLKLQVCYFYWSNFANQVNTWPCYTLQSSALQGVPPPA